MKLLCTADIHMQKTGPRCRTDDYLETAKRKLNWIVDTATDRDVDGIIIAGDLFNRAAPSWDVLASMATILQKADGRPIFVVPGQHEMPDHDPNAYGPLNMLKDLDLITLLVHNDVISEGIGSAKVDLMGTCWGSDPEPDPGADILIWHKLVWHKERPFPGAPDSGSATSILRRFPDVKLVVTGDNHQSFVVEHNGRTLINPGAMMRRAVDEVDMKPAVYIHDLTERKTEKVEIPIDPAVIDTEKHIIQKGRKEQVEAFAENLGTMKFTTDFRANVEKNIPVALEDGTLDKETERMVRKCL